jgi:hypothetical protein
MSHDFWISCGHHLLDRSEGGGLVITDAFLKAYFARPELAPPDDACVVERTLHATLLADPFRVVSPGEVSAIADADARENWQVVLAFRDHLLKHPTLEAAYLALVRSSTVGTPSLFLNQLTHVILRNALDTIDDPVTLRAAEIFFRPQVMTLHEGALLAADEEVIAGVGGNQVSPLVSMLGLPALAAIDVINAENAHGYFARSDAFDMALDLTAGREGQAALARVIACWTEHLLARDVVVEPLTEMRDVNMTWYVGLDAEGTKVGDALWKGDEIGEGMRERVVSLFRLRFDDGSARGASRDPVYLILAMTADRKLRVKPQNLIVGLPAEAELAN